MTREMGASPTPGELRRLIGRLSQDPRVVRRADALDVSDRNIGDLLQRLRGAQTEQGISDLELAQRLRTSEADVKRLMGGLSATLGRMVDVAAELGYGLEFQLVTPGEDSRRSPGRRSSSRRRSR